MSAMNEQPYSKKQLSDIRRALNETKEASGLSWDVIAQAVDTHFYKLTDEQKTFIPLPFRHITYIDMINSASKRVGNKLGEFSRGRRKTIDAMHLIAVAHWLMSEDAVGSSMTYENFFNLSHGSGLAKSLADFLYTIEDGFTSFSYQALKGDYKADLYFDRFIETQIFSICELVNDYVFNLTILRKKNDKLVDSEGGSIVESGTTISHRGWLIAAPFERVYCLTYNHEVGEAEILFPIAVDNGTTRFQSNNASSLALLTKNEIHYIDASLEVDVEDCIDGWLHSNRENITIYQRVE